MIFRPQCLVRGLITKQTSKTPRILVSVADAVYRYQDCEPRPSALPQARRLVY